MSGAFLGPAWRTRAAQRRTDWSRRGAAHLWDPLTILAGKYWTLRSRGPGGRQRAAVKYRPIAAAADLQDDPSKTDLLKLLFLVATPIDVAAQRVGVPVETVALWEQLYFDVRELLTRRCWISQQVIDVERDGNPALAARMKLAVLTGVAGVEAVLALDQTAPDQTLEHSALDQAAPDRRLRLDLKLLEALDQPLTSERQLLGLLKLYVQWQRGEQQQRLAEQRLAARGTAAQDRQAEAQRREARRQERALEKARQAPRPPRRKREAQPPNLLTAAVAHAPDWPTSSEATPAPATVRSASPLLRALSWSAPKSEARSALLPQTLVDLALQAAWPDVPAGLPASPAECATRSAARRPAAETVSQVGA